MDSLNQELIGPSTTPNSPFSPLAQNNSSDLPNTQRNKVSNVAHKIFSGAEASQGSTIGTANQALSTKLSPSEEILADMYLEQILYSAEEIATKIKQQLKIKNADYIQLGKYNLHAHKHTLSLVKKDSKSYTIYLNTPPKGLSRVCSYEGLYAPTKNLNTSSELLEVLKDLRSIQTEMNKPES